MKRALLILVILAAATLHAGDVPFFDKVIADDYSPRRDILVEHYYARNGTDQIWLVSSSDPAKRRLLFTHERSATVLFSSDEEWLVINNHILRNESRLLLYRRVGPLHYEQIADLTNAAWSFFDQCNHLKAPNNFDHSYVEALRWAGDDPPTLLLCLDGHADSRNNTGEWYCLYDVPAKAFSTDFDAHNKKLTKLTMLRVTCVKLKRI